MSFLHFKITSLKNREEEPGVSGDKCSHYTQSDGSPANVSPAPELNHMVFGVVILSRIWGERSPRINQVAPRQSQGSPECDREPQEEARVMRNQQAAAAGSYSRQRARN